MNSPPLAMAWQIWTRHRLGLKISTASLLLMVLLWPPILRSFDSRPVFVLASIPVVLVAAYLANLLLFADEPGNFSSGYPRRMFALPVPTRTLALWPMLLDPRGRRALADHRGSDLPARRLSAPAGFARARVRRADGMEPGHLLVAVQEPVRACLFHHHRLVHSLGRTCLVADQRTTVVERCHPDGIRRTSADLPLGVLRPDSGTPRG